MKTRKITLSGRNPVQIVEEEWPILASASGDSWSGNDYAQHQQALGQGELDRYWLMVRQHTDGRAIVYAVVDGAIAWTSTEDYRSGELLDSGADVTAAILRVGMDAVEHGMPDRMVREALADLPAEKL